MYRYVGIWAQKQYMVCLYLYKYRNQFFYSCPVLELELFQHGTESEVSVCRLYKNWKLFYEISILVYSKCYQFHVIIFIHSFYNQSIIFISFLTVLALPHVIFLLVLKVVGVNMGRYPFDKILIAHEYSFNWFTNLSYILIYFSQIALKYSNECIA